MVPIAITILHCEEKYLFLKRRNPPYENLWSLVGGKVGIGEHIPTAAVREVTEETGAKKVRDYRLKGVVSERLISPKSDLVAHFLIFVGSAIIDNFSENHREGTLSLFGVNELEEMHDQVLPSDYEMFSRFNNVEPDIIEYHEAELIQDNGNYTLSYYREGI
jgi:8-oxo-dGTP diphosphatase